MSLLGSKAVRLCGGGWCFFVAENAIMSENRGVVIEHLGETGYRGCYGALSTGSMAAVAFGWWRHGPGPKIFARGPPAAALFAGAAFQTLGLVALCDVAPALANPFADFPRLACPVDLAAYRDEKARKGDGDDARGLQRVTRHPAFWTLGFLGLGVALRTPFAGTAAAALGFPLVAAVGGAHMDSRHRRGVGGALSPERDAKTSGPPFLALLSGAQSWRALGEEMKPINSALGLSVSAALLWLL